MPVVVAAEGSYGHRSRLYGSEENPEGRNSFFLPVFVPAVQVVKEYPTVLLSRPPRREVKPAPKAHHFSA
jgi:hypothetical protein